MENIFFFLGPADDNRGVKILRIIFGTACIIVAISWLILNIQALKSDATLWITIIFLAAFGFYQIWSGLGRSTRYIEMAPDHIILKKNSILSPVKIIASDIERIELFPLNVIFFPKNRKRILLRFGTTYHETSEKIKDAIISFASANNIPFEIIEENI